MKKYMHLFLLVLLVYTANSQIYFSERYNYGNFLSMDFSHTLLQIEDGYIVPGGYGYRDSLYNRGGLIKIDRYGNELIKKQIVLPVVLKSAVLKWLKNKKPFWVSQI